MLTFLSPQGACGRSTVRSGVVGISGRLLPLRGLFAIACVWLASGATSALGADKASSTSAVIDLPKIFAGGEPTSLAELKAMEQHQRALAEKLTECTVGIVVGPAHGSGVIISQDGYVLTAAHVAGEPRRKVVFVLPDGRRVRGESCGLYRTLDAGLMKITETGPWPFAEMAKSGDLRVGQWCVATGHPGGYEAGRRPVVRIGRVLQWDKSAITTDCTLVGGDSGGPLFDMQGRVIGINSRIGRQLTSNMHVPIAAFHDTWDRLVKGDAWGNTPGAGPLMGVKGDGRSDVAKVASLVPGGPAEKAGVQTGDVIVKFAGQAVKNFAALQSFVNDSQPGEKVALELEREGKSLTVELILGQQREEKED